MKSLAAILFTVITISGYCQHKTYRSDIFICGTKSAPKSYYQFANEDFNTKWGLSPGDTVAIRVGPNGENFIDNIDLGEGTSNGITLIPDTGNKKEIEIGWIGLGGKSYNWTINGKNNYVKRGFLLTDKNHFAFSFTCVGNIEIANCHVNGAMQGIAMYTIPDHTYPLDYQRLHSHDNLIENTIYEAEYLGYVHDSPIAMDLLIERDTILNSGYDGIQTRNTDTVIIKDCYLDGVGMANVDPHSHGILFGSNSNGGTVTNCKLKRVSGVGIWNGGWGNFVYENNEIQANAAGIMSRSSFPEGDVQNTGKQRQVIKNNRIHCGKSVEAYYTETRKAISIDVENNCVTGTINISPLITKTALDNSNCMGSESN